MKAAKSESFSPKRLLTVSALERPCVSVDIFVLSQNLLPEELLAAVSALVRLLTRMPLAMGSHLALS